MERKIVEGKGGSLNGHGGKLQLLERESRKTGKIGL